MPGTALRDLAVTLDAERAQLEAELARLRERMDALAELERAGKRYAALADFSPAGREVTPSGTGAPDGRLRTPAHARTGGNGHPDHSPTVTLSGVAPHDGDQARHTGDDPGDAGSRQLNAPDRGGGHSPTDRPQDAPRGGQAGPPAADAGSAAITGRPAPVTDNGAAQRACAHCDKVFVPITRGGREQKYCGAGCRRKAGSLRVRDGRRSAAETKLVSDPGTAPAAPAPEHENGADFRAVRDAERPFARSAPGA
jgi:hypothetical protein